MKIKEIISRIEQFAPPGLQESYDNCGLLVGDAETDVTKTLVCIDVTEAVIDEAAKKGCNLIISHHPMIFGNITKITANNTTGKCIIKAIKKEIAIYAAHTNLDSVSGGVNSALCERLGILNPKPLRPKKNILKKLITFCPSEKADDVRKALFTAGAGHIGNYDSCSFNSEGAGTFRALDNANPYVGELNKLHFEKEIKIETIYPSYLEKALLKALFASHPYEEVAYDLMPLTNDFNKAGEGMIGELEKPADTIKFLENTKKILGTWVIRHTELIKKKVKKIAVCGGAGGFLIKDAISAQADMLITGDLKYHQFFEGEGKIIIADTGHFESEQFAKEIIVDLLIENFPTFAFFISKTNTNPVHYF